MKNGLAALQNLLANPTRKPKPKRPEDDDELSLLRDDDEDEDSAYQQFQLAPRVPLTVEISNLNHLASPSTGCTFR